jgi:hypothetical protein
MAYLVVPAAAVHDAGAFQMDGNALTSLNSTPPANDDWDRVCHQVVEPNDTTDTTKCTVTDNTTGATAVAWANDGAPNASIFVGGGSKDPQDVNSWAWKDNVGGLPDKDNLLHGFAARYALDPSATCPVVGSAPKCELLYFGSDRLDNSGDAQQGFWFFQNRVSLDPASGTFVMPDPNGGNTPVAAKHKVGDLLILSDFSNGGTTAFIQVFKWVGTGGDVNGGTLQALSPYPTKTNTDGALCGLSSADQFCGVVNPNNGTTAPWSFTDKSGNSTYLQGEFYEAGINLSDLEAGLASECFASFSAETRSSTSPTATLKDFVLGNFGNCSASMTTTPSASNVTPGTAVTDTATVVGSKTNLTPTGTVSFSMCSFDPVTQATEVCDNSDAAHTGTSIGTGLLSGSNGTATATSPQVNTAASPLTPGRYCFYASWPGDSNYVGAIHDTNPTGECFTVAKINTQTVTTPNDGSGVSGAESTITLGSTIYDTAVVTGTAAGGDPTGNVNFFVCAIASGTCDGTVNVGTAVTGNPKALVSDGNASTFTSSATSGPFTPSTVGRYCFRGEYGGSTVYNPSSDSSAGECFTVTDSTSPTTAQNWLPNDSITVNSTNGTNPAGTLAVTLVKGAVCSTGSVVYTEPSITVNGSGPYPTTNTTYLVDASKADTFHWHVVYTPTSSFVTGFDSCVEVSTVSITN